MTTTKTKKRTPAPPRTSHRIRPLNRPRPIQVEAVERCLPAAVYLSGRRLGVETVLESWRIDDEWWREKPVSRAYHRLLLEDGRTLDVYLDLASWKWWRQAY